ncbi:MAG: VOC family protein [Nitrospinota bacterium]
MLKTHGIHHITLICRDMEKTVKFYTEVLGLRLVKQTVNYDDPSSKHFYFGDKTGAPGTVLTFFEHPSGRQAQMGVGITHHLALTVRDEAEQSAWKERLETAGVPVSGPFDRTYFKSIYFRDPDGIIIEMATEGPGFAADEPVEELGSKLILPDASKIRG